MKPDILRVHPDRMTVEIDVRVPGTYVVSEGKIEFFPMPESGYGTQLIKWHQGKWQETEGTTKYR